MLEFDGLELNFFGINKSVANKNLYRHKKLTAIGEFFGIGQEQIFHLLVPREIYELNFFDSEWILK